MGKRKLRNCTNCGTRHGPPTGKNCGRKEDREQESTEKIVDEAELGASAILSENDEEVSAAFTSADLLQDGVDFTDVNLPKRQWSPLMCASKEGTGDRPRSPAGSGASGAMFLRQQLRVMQQERQQFESRIDGRIMHMENVLEKVAGVQQAQLERLVHLANHPIKKTEPEPAATQKAAIAQPTVATPKLNETASLLKACDFSNITVPDSDKEWKDYHGFAAWHLENEKTKKNPFDQQAFVKKGEKVSTFEDLMVIAFKTLRELSELKLDVSGFLSHGLLMAEKASRNVFIQEAFVGYDEEVRKRAGETGPAALAQSSRRRCFATSIMKTRR